jgi:hypothetical protein
MIAVPERGAAVCVPAEAAPANPTLIIIAPATAIAELAAALGRFRLQLGQPAVGREPGTLAVLADFR